MIRIGLVIDYFYHVNWFGSPNHSFISL